MIDFSDILGDEVVIQRDNLSDLPIIWGRQVEKSLSEQEIDHLNMQYEVINSYCEFDGKIFYIVTRKITWDDLISEYGQPLQVGLGPKKGWKWTKFEKISVSHSEFRKKSQDWAKKFPRFVVKCDKEGKSLKPSPKIIGVKR